MGKISPVSAKYIIHANIEISGVVDRPDIIGAVFGQTEGLLGTELELRELQRSGRIGRIEVSTDTKGGKTGGKILIPSSLDKAETAIVGAALEIIQRIGPCNAKIKIENIEDVRVSKRSFIVERAKELLKNLIDSSMPDSQELADEVAYSVRVMEISEYGKDRCPAGPSIDDADEVIVVEGRADVLNLLKHGFKNVIALNGTSIPDTILELSKKKIITAFVDGDRGGNLILKQLMDTCDIDYVTRAPDGKEVEEITKKEIHKAIRSRISGEQANLELTKETERLQTQPIRRPMFRSSAPRQATSRAPPVRAPLPRVVKRAPITAEVKASFKTMLENLVGTRGAHILDEKLSIMGKVPYSEIQSAISSLGQGVYAVVTDGVIDKDMVQIAEKSNIKFLVGMDSKVKPEESKVSILTVSDL